MDGLDIGVSVLAMLQRGLDHLNKTGLNVDYFDVVHLRAYVRKVEGQRDSYYVIDRFERKP
jgi:hypothetical protein